MDYFFPVDRRGNMLQVGDTVRGLPKTSDAVEQGVIDEIRPTCKLNIRFLVGTLKTNRDGDAVSGWHYSESQFLERVEEQQ